MDKRYCKHCSKKLKHIKPSQLKRGRGKYCSLSCSRFDKNKKRDFFGKNNPNWKGGISDNNGCKKRYRLKYPEKYEAHKKMWNAIRKGVLKRSPCEVCGKEKVEGHHTDYSRPLDVVWLCKKHHLDAHKGRFGE